ncbi:hypothetical protein CDL12_18076 [Handroanthus impetiginosus]|uniref:Uncharacterized protein n=1 Tax=Handroanthus impetiginosus TaxID=429701 RepID=A0A2G9GVN7_9LAMI|nr:hypothetical protein CDL12_18076 [Handroanthus impetiginosus]
MAFHLLIFSLHSIAFRGIHKELVRRYEGSFPIVAKIGTTSCRLDLPCTLKITRHVSKPHHEVMQDTSRRTLIRTLAVVTKSYASEIKEVLTSKVARQ